MVLEVLLGEGGQNCQILPPGLLLGPHRSCLSLNPLGVFSSSPALCDPLGSPGTGSGHLSYCSLAGSPSCCLASLPPAAGSPISCLTTSLLFFSLCSGYLRCSQLQEGCYVPSQLSNSLSQQATRLLPGVPSINIYYLLLCKSRLLSHTPAHVFRSLWEW